MPRAKAPPVDLEQYLVGRNHNYLTYQQASRLYGLPYWAFVSVAKEAKATWALRKTAMVDTVVFDRYLEEKCVITEDEDVIYGMEEYVMSKTRKEVENLDELVRTKKKKYVRYAIKRIKEGNKVKDSIPISLNREKHPKLATMLFISHSGASAINAGKIYISHKIRWLSIMLSGWHLQNIHISS